MKRMFPLVCLILTLSVACQIGFTDSVEVDFPTSAVFLKISYGLWEDSLFGKDPKQTEQAMWIVRTGQAEYRFVKWQDSGDSLAAIWSGPPPLGTIAQVHTHPDTADPKPSAKDCSLSRRLNLPVFTVSRLGIWEVYPNGKIIRVTGMGWYRQWE